MREARRRRTRHARLSAQGSVIRRFDTDRGGSARVTLRPAFYTLDDTTRRKYVDAIYSYVFDGSSVNDTLILRDGQHGNETSIKQYIRHQGAEYTQLHRQQLNLF